MESGNWKINVRALHHLPPNDHIISPTTQKRMEPNYGITQRDFFLLVVTKSNAL